MTPEEFRRAGHELVDWIADYRLGLEHGPVRHRTGPGAVAARFSARPPGDPVGLGELLEQVDQVVLPGLTQVQHPMHFGWFPSNASLASVLGDMMSSGLGSLGISWESAPALTELEEVMCDWFRQLTGLSEAWSGTIHDTASTSCLVAMILARERTTGYCHRTTGLAGVERAPVAYCTGQAHSSVNKAVQLAGFGAEHLRIVAHNSSDYGLDPDDLRARVAADRAAGLAPSAVVATVGTTATTAIDPVAEVVEVAREFGLWVHVDAAMAGSAMLLPECRALWQGVEGADSITWNPHKWLGTILDTSLFYVRDIEHLVRVMSTNPSYLRSGADGSVTQYRDWGIPLGRRFRALKLWFHLRLDGLGAIQQRLRRDLDNAAWLAQQIVITPNWEVVAPVPLQTVCAIHVPAHLAHDTDSLNRHTLAWVEAVNATGDAYLTPSLVDGRWVVRVSIGVEGTKRVHVERVWNLMRSAAEQS